MSLGGRRKVTQFLLKRAAREILVKRSAKGLFDFGRFHDCYREEVQDSISFTGASHEFFMRVKAERLVISARALLGDLSGRKALDVGCGMGLTDAFLTGAFGEVHGVDLFPKVIRAAKKANPKARYKVYGGERLPYPDGAFDVAFAICVLHHVPPSRHNHFIKEMARVTRPGGMMAVFEHNPLNPLTVRAVNTCVLDDEAILIKRWKAERLLDRQSRGILESRLMFRWLDERLGWLPLGAQYMVTAVR